MVTASGDNGFDSTLPLAAGRAVPGPATVSMRPTRITPGYARPSSFQWWAGRRVAKVDHTRERQTGPCVIDAGHGMATLSRRTHASNGGTARPPRLPPQPGRTPCRAQVGQVG